MKGSLSTTTSTGRNPKAWLQPHSLCVTDGAALAGHPSLVRGSPAASPFYWWLRSCSTPPWRAALKAREAGPPHLHHKQDCLWSLFSILNFCRRYFIAFFKTL